MEEEAGHQLPIAIVGKIMKQALPTLAKISKEAKETMQECATEFISFVTGEASDKCQKENRKTVNGDDICWALSSLGFDNYAVAITSYLQKLREYEREKAITQKGLGFGVGEEGTCRSLESMRGSSNEEDEAAQHHHQQQHMDEVGKKRKVIN